MVKEIVFNYLSMKIYWKLKKKLYIYKLFFEINPNTLSTGELVLQAVGGGGGVLTFSMRGRGKRDL